MNKAEALRIVIAFCAMQGDAEARAAALVLAENLGKKSEKPDAAPSERGLAFADWFRSTLAESARLAPGWREKWGREYDRQMALGRTPEQLWRVCRWARVHDFWRAAFLSPAKLRETRGGVTYFDRFEEAMRAGSGGGAAARKAATAAGQYALDEGRGPAAVSADELLEGGQP